jgi:polyphosphate kinase 2
VNILKHLLVYINIIFLNIQEEPQMETEIVEKNILQPKIDSYEIDGEKISLETLINSYKRKKELSEFENKAIKKRRQEQELKPYQAELIKLQKHLEITGKKMIILFEGRDAAGKGGTIRRVTRYMNEKHYRVVALGKPTEEQKTQWYYQKYIQHFPHAGEMVLFDRSWYNRAMVEPVFGFCTQKEYEDFMKGVKGFEKDLVRQGTILIKLYFSVTKDEQARRFERRKTDPLRQWKLSEIDVQAQERWDDFTNTKYTMLKQTHSHTAPWKIIRSNNKHKARLEALKIILNKVDYENRDMSLNYTLDQNIAISGARELEIMEAQRTKNGKFIG